MTGAKRPAGNDWYTAYFAPTTVLIAVTVLLLSIEAGKYAGNYFIERDKAAQAAIQVTTALPPAPKAPTKATTHRAPARSHTGTAGKTQH